MRVLLVSLVWGWGTAIFQLSGLYSRLEAGNHVTQASVILKHQHARPTFLNFSES